MNACCNAAITPGTWARRIREVFAWGLPGTMLALVPKCPACLAAYVALWTGFGLSLGAARYLRWAMMLISVVALLFLIIKRLNRIRGLFNHAKTETEPCTTRS